MDLKISLHIDSLFDSLILYICTGSDNSEKYLRAGSCDVYIPKAITGYLRKTNLDNSMLINFYSNIYVSEREDSRVLRVLKLDPHLKCGEKFELVMFLRHILMKDRSVIYTFIELREY